MVLTDVDGNGIVRGDKPGYHFVLSDCRLSRGWDGMDVIQIYSNRTGD